ncbi:hypothetical protein Agub_g3706 [Astrephomene gubernaculifera]|uniref:Rad21/Rec8-like protein C-terminal eukaryotic domain-containing protein n=1 Tax=Astrephomene gubernaculifera TaxID=47775 RepID=A0AAD3HJF9_9CHLO|nr:hypothetical protein Agub_g3706 [Astrephomene gubernaculifera]
MEMEVFDDDGGDDAFQFDLEEVEIERLRAVPASEAAAAARSGAAADLAALLGRDISGGRGRPSASAIAEEGVGSPSSGSMAGDVSRERESAGHLGLTLGGLQSAVAVRRKSTAATAGLLAAGGGELPDLGGGDLDLDLDLGLSDESVGAGGRASASAGGNGGGEGGERSVLPRALSFTAEELRAAAEALDRAASAGNADPYDIQEEVEAEEEGLEQIREEDQGIGAEAMEVEMEDAVSPSIRQMSSAGAAAAVGTGGQSSGDGGGSGGNTSPQNSVGSGGNGTSPSRSNQRIVVQQTTASGAAAGGSAAAAALPAPSTGAAASAGAAAASAPPPVAAGVPPPRPQASVSVGGATSNGQGGGGATSAGVTAVPTTSNTPKPAGRVMTRRAAAAAAAAAEAAAVASQDPQGDTAAAAPTEAEQQPVTAAEAEEGVAAGGPVAAGAAGAVATEAGTDVGGGRGPQKRKARAANATAGSRRVPSRRVVTVDDEGATLATSVLRSWLQDRTELLDPSRRATLPDAAAAGASARRVAKKPRLAGPGAAAVAATEITGGAATALAVAAAGLVDAGALMAAGSAALGDWPLAGPALSAAAVAAAGGFRRVRRLGAAAAAVAVAGEANVVMAPALQALFRVPTGQMAPQYALQLGAAAAAAAGGAAAVGHWCTAGTAAAAAAGRTNSAAAAAASGGCGRPTDSGREGGYSVWAAAAAAALGGGLAGAETPATATAAAVRYGSDSAGGVYGMSPGAAATATCMSPPSSGSRGDSGGVRQGTAAATSAMSGGVGGAGGSSGAAGVGDGGAAAEGEEDVGMMADADEGYDMRHEAGPSSGSPQGVLGATSAGRNDNNSNTNSATPSAGGLRSCDSNKENQHHNDPLAAHQCQHTPGLLHGSAALKAAGGAATPGAAGRVLLGASPLRPLALGQQRVAPTTAQAQQLGKEGGVGTAAAAVCAAAAAAGEGSCSAQEAGGLVDAMDVDMGSHAAEGAEVGAVEGIPGAAAAAAAEAPDGMDVDEEGMAQEGLREQQQQQASYFPAASPAASHRSHGSLAAASAGAAGGAATPLHGSRSHSAFRAYDVGIGGSGGGGASLSTPTTSRQQQEQQQAASGQHHLSQHLHSQQHHSQQQQQQEGSAGGAGPAVGTPQAATASQQQRLHLHGPRPMGHQHAAAGTPPSQLLGGGQRSQASGASGGGEGEEEEEGGMGSCRGLGLGSMMRPRQQRSRSRLGMDLDPVLDLDEVAMEGGCGGGSQEANEEQLQQQDRLTHGSHGGKSNSTNLPSRSGGPMRDGANNDLATASQRRQDMASAETAGGYGGYGFHGGRTTMTPSIMRQSGNNTEGSGYLSEGNEDFLLPRTLKEFDAVALICASSSQAAAAAADVAPAGGKLLLPASQHQHRMRLTQLPTQAQPLEGCTQQRPAAAADGAGAGAESNTGAAGADGAAAAAGSLSLLELTRGRRRKDAARCFYDMLVLKNRGLLDLHQVPYNGSESSGAGGDPWVGTQSAKTGTTAADEANVAATEDAVHRARSAAVPDVLVTLTQRGADAACQRLDGVLSLGSQRVEGH